VSKVENAHRRGRELIALLDSVTEVPALGDRPAQLIVSIAAVSRCRSLLLGVLELDDVGRTDLIGVLLRALLEVWYLGVIALLGDAADLALLEADQRYWRNRLAEHLEGIAQEPGQAQPFSVWDRATRADELLSAIGEQPGIARDYYRIMFAGESLSSAHASLESLKAYVSEDEDGTVLIAHEPEPDDEYRYGRLHSSGVLTALLAKWTWERVGFDGGVFDALGF
jgi:hypothetical protein